MDPQARRRSQGEEKDKIYFDQAGALVLGGRIKGNLPTRAAYSITGNAGLYLHTSRTNVVACTHIDSAQPLLRYSVVEIVVTKYTMPVVSSMNGVPVIPT